MTISSSWTRRSVPSRRSTTKATSPVTKLGLVEHHIVVRADSAGATHGFVRGLIEANIEYSIGHPVDQAVREALLSFQEEDWRRSHRGGRDRP